VQLQSAKQMTSNMRGSSVQPVSKPTSILLPPSDLTASHNRPAMADSTDHHHKRPSTTAVNSVQDMDDSSSSVDVGKGGNKFVKKRTDEAMEIPEVAVEIPSVRSGSLTKPSQFQFLIVHC